MRIQTLKGHFWKRYKSEYIAELQKRQKWRRQEEQLTLEEDRYSEGSLALGL